MAKFTKSFDLWAEDESGVMNIDKIRSGELVIQRGQWVNICGERPSRWVGISPGGSVWAIHPKYKKGEQLQDFLTLARNVRQKSSGRQPMQNAIRVIASTGLQHNRLERS